MSNTTDAPIAPALVVGYGSDSGSRASAAANYTATTRQRQSDIAQGKPTSGGGRKRSRDRRSRDRRSRSKSKSRRGGNMTKRRRSRGKRSRSKRSRSKRIRSKRSRGKTPKRRRSKSKRKRSRSKRQRGGGDCVSQTVTAQPMPTVSGPQVTADSQSTQATTTNVSGTANQVSVGLLGSTNNLGQEKGTNPPCPQAM